jgi:hypothetical protein
MVRWKTSACSRRRSRRTISVSGRPEEVDTGFDGPDMIDSDKKYRPTRSTPFHTDSASEAEIANREAG